MRMYPENAQIQNKPKIYIACCKDDEDLFRRVGEMILSVRADVVMFCRESEDEDDLINHMNIFVFPISTEILNSDQYMKSEIDSAIKNNIPVLPLIMQGIDRKEFEKYFGRTQSLNIFEKDVTELPFKEKLKSFLDSVLVDSSLRKRISDSLRAKIFLSYRKKDRKYALQIMKAVHSDERFRDVAIWFDEFLVPGEEYNQAIKNELENSDIVILLVSPSVLETGNYVMVHEYPDSVNNGKKIIPVEAVETDKTDLAAKFIDLPNLVLLDEKSISEALLVSGLPDDDKSILASERDYCVGMAFLHGILAEKNTKYALEALERAAENGSADAYKQLVAYYRYGNRKTKNLDTATVWQSKYYRHLIYINRDKTNPDIKGLVEEIIIVVRLLIEQYHEIQSKPILTSINNEPVENYNEKAMETLLGLLKEWMNGLLLNISRCRDLDSKFYSRKLIDYYNLLFEVSEFDKSLYNKRIAILDKVCDSIEKYSQLYGYEIDLTANYGHNLYKKGLITLIDYDPEEQDDPEKCRARFLKTAEYYAESYKFFDTLLKLDDSIGLKRSAAQTIYSLASVLRSLGKDNETLLEYINNAIDILEITNIQTGDFDDMADLANAYDFRGSLTEGDEGVEDLKNAVNLMEQAWRGNGRFFYQVLYLQIKDRLEKRLGESS